MKTVTIEIRNKSAEDFLHVLEKQKAIRIVDNSSKEKFKRKLKKDLTEAFNQVRLAEQGKVKLKSARELYNEL